jgi:inward rectifier potassium channel
VRSTRLLLGGYAISYAITTRGVAGFDPRDTYHLIIAISWPRFLLIVVCAHLAINIGFALLFMAQPVSIAHMRPGSFADAFFFSVETSATVGYGDMHPVTVYGHAVCTAEIFVGIAFTALTTGLLFVRFARPKARIRFAENAVVALHVGQPTLMVRLANGRSGMLYDAVAHLALLLSIRGERGEVVRRLHELRLARSRLPIFALTWTLMHRIDDDSPLRNYDAARLLEHDAHLLVGIGGHDVTLAAQVVDIKGYSPSKILFGMRYADVFSFDAQGHPVADLAAVSGIERDVGDEPLLSGWEDRHWNEGEP